MYADHCPNCGLPITADGPCPRGAERIARRAVGVAAPGRDGDGRGSGRPVVDRPRDPANPGSAYVHPKVDVGGGHLVHHRGMVDPGR